MQVLSGLWFFPRGGSSHAARALCAGLRGRGHEASIVSGSRSDAAKALDATAFYAPLPVRAVDFAPALLAPEPVAYDPGRPGTAPMHASFEDRSDAPDVIAAALGHDAFETQAGAWERELDAAAAGRMDVLHLHHLTPLHEAARRVAPGVPIVTQLHGTELLMLEAIASGPPPDWDHAAAWAERMRGWARESARVTAATKGGAARASALLELDVEVLPNGFDEEAFRPRPVDRAEHWLRHLVHEPRGWRAGGDAGSLAYRERDVAGLARGPVLLYAGRFTAVKRLGLLVRAWERARPALPDDAALVLVGGHPGEWEGEHPQAVVEETGAQRVFLAGWHGHDELPAFVNASDVLVLPSVREQFGQVLVEAMGCAVPPIAVARGGPAEIVDDGETGWLVEPDDERALAGAIAEALSSPSERARRGEAARAAARARWSWTAAAARLEDLLEEARRG